MPDMAPVHLVCTEIVGQPGVVSGAEEGTTHPVIGPRAAPRAEQVAHAGFLSQERKARGTATGRAVPAIPTL